MDIPKYDDLFSPILKALQELGGSATNEELEDELTKSLGLTQEQLDLTYPKSGAPVVSDECLGLAAS